MDTFTILNDKNVLVTQSNQIKWIFHISQSYSNELFVTFFWKTNFLFKSKPIDWKIELKNLLHLSFLFEWTNEHMKSRSALSQVKSCSNETNKLVKFYCEVFHGSIVRIVAQLLVQSVSNIFNCHKFVLNSLTSNLIHNWFSIPQNVSIL